MSIVLVAPIGLDLKMVAPWAAGLATVMGQSLTVITYHETSTLPENTDDHNQRANLESVLASHFEASSLEPVFNPKEATNPAELPDESVVVLTRTIRNADPIDEVLNQLDQIKPLIVLLPRHHSTKFKSAEMSGVRRLFQQCSRPIMQIRLPLEGEPQFKKVIILTGCEQSSRYALRAAHRLTQASNGTLDAIFIQPDVGVHSEQIGQRHINSIVTRTLSSEGENVQQRVLIARDLKSGFASIQSMDHDLIIIGAEYHSVIERNLFSNVSEQLITSPDGPPVAVYRKEMPFQDRIRKRIERLLSRSVPQLDRQQRVDLVDRIQQSSEWDIDFIALIVLSTMIAALGLLQNSGAVVIGAMLVAPLMTPLLGMGLSLVQGNKLLVRKASRTVLLGFITAWFLGIILAILVPGSSVTSQMVMRGSPGLPDIIIAFLSGMAAVYAMGRPHLTSALPGVAIAASLVPPIATSGLATTLGNYTLATGSALLFLTNIVAIVLGGAFAWWVTGFRDAHEHGGFERWTPRVVGALFILAVGLGIYESWPRSSNETQLRTAIVEILEEQAQECSVIEVDIDTTVSPEKATLILGSANGPHEELHDEFATAVQATTSPEAQTHIEWRRTWTINGSAQTNE